MDVQKVLFELKGEKALEVLHVMSYFAPADIEMDLFSDFLGGTEDLKNAVDLMKRHSLVQSGDNETSIRIGTEVRQEVQKILRQEEKEEAVVKKAIEFFSKHFSSAILDHAMSVFNAVKKYPELLNKVNNFASDIMGGLIMQERCFDFRTFSWEVLDVLQRSIGEYHTSTLNFQLRLGLALLQMNQVEEGLEVLCEVYQKKSIVLGERTINEHLAIIAWVMTIMTSEPESRLRRLVFGDVTVSETDNSTALKNWLKYALLLSTLRWKDETLPILVQVLEKKREIPNEDDICDLEEVIANWHIIREESQKALEIFQRVYEKKKASFGENCLKTHLSRRNIGIAYDSLGMFDEALVEYEASAENIKKLVGDDDNIYLETLDKIGSVLYRQKKYKEAFDLNALLHDDYARVLGEGDIKTLRIKFRISNILLDQGKNEESLSTWQETVNKYIEGRDSETVDFLKVISLFAQPGNQCRSKEVSKS